MSDNQEAVIAHAENDNIDNASPGDDGAQEPTGTDAVEEQATVENDAADPVGAAAAAAAAVAARLMANHGQEAPPVCFLTFTLV